MNRRGLFAAIALSPFIAVNAIAKPKPEGEPHNAQTSLVLNGNMKPSKPTTVGGSGKFLTMDGWINIDPNKQVAMAVGEDGNLWLKSKGGEWKRVVTE
jgi:hypothetical protein